MMLRCITGLWGRGRLRCRWILRLRCVAKLNEPRDYAADLKTLLAGANICDKRWVYEQYDSMVQTNTVQGPGGEAGVMRIKGTTNARAGDGAGREWSLDLSRSEAWRDACGR